MSTWRQQIRNQRNRSEARGTNLSRFTGSSDEGLSESRHPSAMTQKRRREGDCRSPRNSCSSVHNIKWAIGKMYSMYPYPSRISSRLHACGIPVTFFPYQAARNVALHHDSQHQWQAHIFQPRSGPPRDADTNWHYQNCLVKPRASHKFVYGSGHRAI